MPGPCILIIDDEPIARQSLDALLSGEGYELNFALDGSDGFQKAIELHPDVILLDVMLPAVDGYEVCRQLRREPSLAEIPILFLTASTIESQDCGVWTLARMIFSPSPLTGWNYAPVCARSHVLTVTEN